MNVALTPELEQLVNERIESGLYHSASEVVHEALRLLKERDELRKQHREQLRAEIRIGLEQLERGEAKVYDDDSLKELFEAVKSRGRERLAQQQERGAG